MSSIGKPAYAFPPTTEPRVSDWYEVAASFDTRTELPRAMAVCAVTAEGMVLPHLTNNSIEIELPFGAVAPLAGGQGSVLPINFPGRWRINKPPTQDEVTYAIYGVGETTNQQD